jgi:predicted dehydrogenase
MAADHYRKMAMSPRNETAPLRAVVVGTSFGSHAHVPALQAAGFDVVALVGQNQERTEERARQLEVPHALLSLESALELEPDVVAISTPPATHAPLTRQAIAAGCHLLVEKPFTLDGAEARELAALAHEAGVVNLIAHEFRWAPTQALVAQLLADGAVGEPRTATIVGWIPYAADPKAAMPEWWFNPELGGGWLGAAGVHTIDQIHTWLGDVSAARGTLSVVSDRPRDVADDTFTAELTMTSGCQVLLQQTAAAWGMVGGVTAVAGTTGTIWVSGGDVWLADREGSRVVPLPSDLEKALAIDEPDPAGPRRGMEFLPFVRMGRYLKDRILEPDTTPVPVGATFDDGVAVMDVVDALQKSSREGGAVVEVPAAADR